MRNAVLVGLMVAGVVSEVAAQQPEGLGQPRFHAGGALVLAKPTGEFAEYVNMGFGLAGHASVDLKAGGPLALRADGIFIVYGSETTRYQLLPLIEVDVTTTNQIAAFQFGPQWTVGEGSVRGYGYGQVGFSYFATTSSVEGSNDATPFANTTNFDDLTFAASAGGGLRFRLSSGWTPVWLDLGVRYMRNGQARYLREGSIEISGNDVTITPIESETNIFLFKLGVTIGIRGARPE